eukprot:609417-Rhodomonas_salina.1
MAYLSVGHRIAVVYPLRFLDPSSAPLPLLHPSGGIRPCLSTTHRVARPTAKLSSRDHVPGSECTEKSGCLYLIVGHFRDHTCMLSAVLSPGTRTPYVSTGHRRAVPAACTW